MRVGVGERVEAFGSGLVPVRWGLVGWLVLLFTSESNLDGLALQCVHCYFEEQIYYRLHRSFNEV